MVASKAVVPINIHHTFAKWTTGFFFEQRCPQPMLHCRFDPSRGTDAFALLASNFCAIASKPCQTGCRIKMLPQLCHVALVASDIFGVLRCVS